ncbi:MAG: DoxX-like family protein [Anaerolineales bacterium]|nr:DoxX-like family protein [Anaerolineales bacterium]
MQQTNPPPGSCRNRLEIVAIVAALFIFTVLMAALRDAPPLVGLTLGLAAAFLHAARQWWRGWQAHERLRRAFARRQASRAAFTVHALALAREAQVGLRLAERFLDRQQALRGGEREEDEGWGQGTMGTYAYRFPAGMAPIMADEDVLSPFQAVIHGALALLWLYQGLVPKLMFPQMGETALVGAMMPAFIAPETYVTIFGWLEILFGLLFLWPRLARPLHWLNIAVLIGLGMAPLLVQPHLYAAPFNPASLSLAMMALSLAFLAASSHERAMTRIEPE